MGPKGKYSKRIAKAICSMIAKDSYTIAEICSTVGISERSYYQWQSSNAEFAADIEKAREKFDEMLVAEAKKSMVKKVKGYTVQETKTVFIDSGKKDDDGKAKPKIKERTVTDKHFQPDTGMIVFALTNKVPEEYKNRQNTELTGKDGKDLITAMTDEELDKKIAKLASALHDKK